MRVGISVTSSHPGIDPAHAVNHVIARARVAAEAGLDHLSLGDKHATGVDNAYVQNVPLIGRIMADWPQDRPIGALFLLPLWNPVLVAEQVGTLAAMTNAPFIVQTGIGSGAGQFTAMGASLSERGRRIDEAIAVIKRLLAGEVVDSELFGMAGAAIAPRPPRPVEWWIGSGIGDRPLSRAAGEGDAWYVMPNLSTGDLTGSTARYRELCDQHGTTPRVALRRDLFIADSDEEGLRRGRDLVAGGYRGMTEDTLIFGGVERVAERLAAFAELGVDDIVARTMAVDQSAALRSIELLGLVRLQLA